MKEVIEKGYIHTLYKTTFKSGGAMGLPEKIFTDYWIERKGKVIFRIGENMNRAKTEFNRLNENYGKRNGLKKTIV
jgi:hypothetical protein